MEVRKTLLRRRPDVGLIHYIRRNNGFVRKSVAKGAKLRHFLRVWAFFRNFGAVKQSATIFSTIFAALAIASCGCSKPDSQSAATAPVAQAKVLQTPEFSADSAYAYVERQVAFGPRVPGSEARTQCASWLASELRRHGADTVLIQQAELPGYGPMTNVMGRFNLEAEPRVLLVAHWDSRPWADEDPDPANRTKPIDGANDGASGTGVLLELARLMGKEAPQTGVDILLVDAEDSGTSGNDDSWALGAQYWAQHMPYDESGERLPAYAVLLDMVGGRNAVFPREMISEVNCRQLNDRVWNIARNLGLSARFPNSVGGAVNDDHVPLLRVGIPAIDIIETNHPQTGSFNPTWHTLADNMDNIDRATLGDVGRVVTHLIYSQK